MEFRLGVALIAMDGVGWDGVDVLMRSVVRQDGAFAGILQRWGGLVFLCV